MLGAEHLDTLGFCVPEGLGKSSLVLSCLVMQYSVLEGRVNEGLFLGINP